MRKTLIAAFVLNLLLVFSHAAFARGDGNGHAGGNAVGRFSDNARENTNAQWSAGADKGQQRADERRSDQGMAHEEAKPKTPYKQNQSSPRHAKKK